MDSNTLWQAFALMLVIEGLMPFFAPDRWRAMFKKMLSMHNGQIRFFGLCSMALGVLALVLLV